MIIWFLLPFSAKCSKALLRLLSLSFSSFGLRTNTISSSWFEADLSWTARQFEVIGFWSTSLNGHNFLKSTIISQVRLGIKIEAWNSRKICLLFLTSIGVFTLGTGGGCGPPGRLKSSIVGLPLVVTEFEWSSKQISRKRGFGPHWGCGWPANPLPPSSGVCPANLLYRRISWPWVVFLVEVLIHF